MPLAPAPDHPDRWLYDHLLKLEKGLHALVVDALNRRGAISDETAEVLKQAAAALAPPGSK